MALPRLCALVTRSQSHLSATDPYFISLWQTPGWNCIKRGCYIPFLGSLSERLPQDIVPSYDVVDNFGCVSGYEVWTR